MDISVVMAVYNEEECIFQELERTQESLLKSGKNCEIVIVNDASKDKSLSIIEKFIRENKKVSINLINLKRNGGSGNARKTGTIAAQGKIVVWTDADMTYPNHEIHLLVQKMEEQGADQMVGARNREMGTLKIFRTPAKLFLRKLAEYLSGTKIPDLNTGFRAFKRDVSLKFMKLIPNGFSCVTTLTLCFLTDNLFVAYTPITYETRVGKSKFHPIKDTAKYFRQIILMVMMFRPLRIFTPIFLILLMTAIGWSAYTICNFGLIPASAIVLFSTALHMISVGLLAELIIKTRN